MFSNFQKKIPKLFCQEATSSDAVNLVYLVNHESKSCSSCSSWHDVVYCFLFFLTAESPWQFYNVSGNNSIGDVTYMYFMNICVKVKNVACPVLS